MILITAKVIAGLPLVITTAIIAADVRQLKIMSGKKDSTKSMWSGFDKKGTSPLLGHSGPFGQDHKFSSPEELKENFDMPPVESFDGGEGLIPPLSEMAGNLSMFAARDPDAFEGIPDTDHYLNLNLRGNEWEAIFYDMLGCPKAIDDPFSPGETSVEQWRERYRLKFQAAIPDYPMLSRIWDFYIYVSYEPGEITQLYEECLRVRASASSERALAGITKLLSACEEATKHSSGLLFVPD